LEDHVVSKTGLKLIPVQVVILLLPGLLKLLNNMVLQLLKIGADAISQCRFLLLGMLDHLSNMQMGDAVTAGQLGREVRFTDGGWATDENFQREEPSKHVEFFVKEREAGLADTLRAVEVRVDEGSKLI